ncbi:thrombomodulin [Rhea pennata]|uniref:thrombomodulin n=1 Tax=Rhea pennata TaxID=8795 RepID=UPI002E27372D
MRRLPLPLLLAAAAAGLALGLPPAPEPAPSGTQCIEHDCFSVFWQPGPFRAASAACGRRGGHLMTVRSTVAEDAIALLVQSRSGSLWLGLRLPRDCTEPSQKLRGFQWVTGDRRTDYVNWRQQQPQPRCGQRCVTVAWDLSWEERRCDAVADGFLCEFNYEDSCPKLQPAAGVAVTYTTPFGARDSDFLALPPGSAAHVAPLGLELRCAEAAGDGGLRWGRDTPGAWPCELGNGGCEETCRTEHGRPHCLCPAGKQLGADGRSCSSPCADAPCQHHCIPNGPSFLCMCDSGYELAADGSSCRDIDDCATKPDICDQECINTEGGFMCRCYQGYKMMEGHCRFVSHCYEAPCKHECEDVPGGYRCHCFEGYATHPLEPTQCVLHCDQSECLAKCDPHTENFCECPEGFIFDDRGEGMLKFCVDIDECNMNYCNQSCTNHPGGFTCHCDAGYKLVNQYQCAKISKEEEIYSGDSEPSPQTPTPTRTPPKAGHLPAGVLVGIIVGILSMVLVLLALVYHLMKKCCRSPSSMDYKCNSSTEKEMGLHQVTPGCTSPNQKL